MFLVLLQNNSTERLWCSALFLGEFLESDALELGSCSLGALRHDLSTPWLSDFFGTFVEVGVDWFNQFAQSRSVFSVDIGQSNTRTVLEANKSSESGFTLDNAVWDAHSAAEGWKEKNNFNWVNIVSDDDQLGAFLFDLSGNTVDTDRQEVWLGIWGISGTVSPEHNIRITFGIIICKMYKYETYLASDRAKSLAFLAARVSGLYFSANLKKLAAVCLSKVWIKY